MADRDVWSSRARPACVTPTRAVSRRTFAATAWDSVVGLSTGRIPPAVGMSPDPPTSPPSPPLDAGTPPASFRAQRVWHALRFQFRDPRRQEPRARLLLRPRPA